ncbi:hypothetical protein RU86_GL002202 [Lactococcus piscium]|uniref:Uncharacterized protein n=1 Tax=Pseudolactococcus piscium TaxID=1364 RepID=A0A2A5S0X0_9LACT|nr:hypothetical protein RU86_GL002202 [Lactococcus piscium]
MDKMNVIPDVPTKETFSIESTQIIEVLFETYEMVRVA